MSEEKNQLTFTQFDQSTMPVTNLFRFKLKKNIAQMNRRVDILIGTKMKNELGGFSVKWRKAYPLWCKISEDRRCKLKVDKAIYTKIDILMFRYSDKFKILLNSLKKPTLKFIRFKYHSNIYIPKEITLDQNYKFIIIKTILDGEYKNDRTNAKSIL